MKLANTYINFVTWNISMKRRDYTYEQYLIDLEHKFHVELSGKYEEIVRMINSGYQIYKKDDKSRRLKDLMQTFLVFIKQNWVYVENLSKDELYMIISIIRLSRSENIEFAVRLSNSEEYQDLCQNYTNSR